MGLERGTKLECAKHIKTMAELALIMIPFLSFPPRSQKNVPTQGVVQK